MHWDVPVELDTREKRLVKMLGRGGKFFVFLREIRHRLFDAGFEAELATAYGKARGTAPVPPAMLAMVSLLQAYTQTGDFKAVEAAVSDLKWQLVLGCLGCEEPPFSQGVLVSFRERMIAKDLDQRLLARVVELAKETGGFGFRNLKAALDSSPLLGAGRVEDSWNLVGHGLSALVTCAAKSLGVPRARVLADAGLTLLSGRSLKATLDIDWDDPVEQAEALKRLLAEVQALETWVAAQTPLAEDPPVQDALKALRRILDQDFEPDPNGGGPRIRRGVAKDRMPSLGDQEMRHGRKSESKRFNGYKRHVVKLVGLDLIVGAVVFPANEAEHKALEPLLKDVRAVGEPEALLFDRGYLGSPVVGQYLEQGGEVICKPWSYRNGDRFSKADFTIDLERGVVTCPAGQEAAISPGGQQASFHPSACGICELKARCTKAKTRSVTIHPQEALLLDLRAKKKTKEGRNALRERTTIEHSLASVSRIQGNRARYTGTRKNTFDLRRCATVVNLQVLARRERLPARAAA